MDKYVVQLKSFTVEVSEAVLQDVRDRLLRTRWPIEPVATPWAYGTDLSFMKSVVAYWANEYDWRQAEAAINKFQNFKACVDGLDIHFIMEKGSGLNPRPIILTHGWPGSFMEFFDVIEPLAHPERYGGKEEDAFTVVVPSIPGFGFSQAPEQPITLRDVSRLWKDLMIEHLGFTSFFAQGGDMGSVVSSWLAFDNPNHVAALHLNYVSFIVVDHENQEEREWLARNTEWTRPEEGYRTQQGTRPQTLAYGLTDSPNGLAAWIIEKYQRWTIPGESREPPFKLKQLLDNVMLYWIAGPNAPSWYYVSVIKEIGRRRFPDGRRVEAPTGVLICPRDIMVPLPDRIIQRSYNMVSRTDARDGGHFVAMEQPELFVDEMRSFFRPYR